MYLDVKGKTVIPKVWDEGLSKYINFCHFPKFPQTIRLHSLNKSAVSAHILGKNSHFS